MTQNTVQWSKPMDPTAWDSDADLVTVTTCLNRFELLASGELPSEIMRRWAHEQLDAWLDKR